MGSVEAGIWSAKRPADTLRRLPSDGVMKDVGRIRDWTERRLIGSGMAIFVDEGGFAHDRRTALPECQWTGWGTYGEPTLDVWVHAYALVHPVRSGPIP
jgi:hypothetical protein